MCLSLFRDPIALRCGHAYCRACAATLRLRSEPKRARCPGVPSAFTRRVKMKKHPPHTCLRNAAACWRTAEEREADDSIQRARAAEEAAEERRREIDGALGECLIAASANDPPVRGGGASSSVKGCRVHAERATGGHVASHRVSFTAGSVGHRR